MAGNRSTKHLRKLPAILLALLAALLAFGAISAAARDGETTETTPTTPTETPVIEVPTNEPPVVQLPPVTELEKPIESVVGGEKSPSKPVTQPTTQSEGSPATSTSGSQSSGGASTGTSTTTGTSTSKPARGGTRAAHATSNDGGDSNSGSTGRHAGSQNDSGSRSNAPSAPLPSHAPTQVANHVQKVISGAIPSRQLKDAGTALAVHLGLASKHSGRTQKDEVANLGKALGTALVGSAVAVDRTPPSAKPTGPIAIFSAPEEHAFGALLVVALAILALFGGFLYVQFRATRRGALPLQVNLFGRTWEPARTAIRIETAMQGPRNVLERGVLACRRAASAASDGLRAATAGLRSFF